MMSFRQQGYITCAARVEILHTITEQLQIDEALTRCGDCYLLTRCRPRSKLTPSISFLAVIVPPILAM